MVKWASINSMVEWVSINRMVKWAQSEGWLNGPRLQMGPNESSGVGHGHNWAQQLPNESPSSQAAQPATAHSSTKLGWANLPDKYNRPLRARRRRGGWANNLQPKADVGSLDAILHTLRATPRSGCKLHPLQIPWPAATRYCCLRRCRGHAPRQEVPSKQRA